MVFQKDNSKMVSIQDLRIVYRFLDEFDIFIAINNVDGVVVLGRDGIVVPDFVDLFPLNFDIIKKDYIEVISNYEGTPCWSVYMTDIRKLPDVHIIGFDEIEKFLWPKTTFIRRFVRWFQRILKI